MKWYGKDREKSAIVTVSNGIGNKNGNGKKPKREWSGTGNTWGTKE